MPWIICPTCKGNCYISAGPMAEPHGCSTCDGAGEVESADADARCIWCALTMAEGCPGGDCVVGLAEREPNGASEVEGRGNF